MQQRIIAPTFLVGDWIVDPALDELRAAGTSVKLEPRMMRLLCYLAERPGQVVSTEELLAAIWPGVIVGQASVYQAVATLRRLLHDDSADPQYIATVPRKGYRLVAAVTPAADAPPSLAETPAALEQRSVLAAQPRRLLGWLLLCAAVLLLGVAVWRTVGPQGVAALPAQPALPTAIAVLPFIDLSSEKDNQPFCDSIAEELLNALAQVPELRVTARTSAFKFRGGAVDVRDVGQQLGVSHIVEGSVRRDGARVRIAVQLINVTDGFQVWSDSIDRPYENLLQIQRDIAGSLVASLKLPISSPSRARLARVPTSTVGAYEFYLLGRYQQLQRKPDALQRAVDYHTQAIALDPKFALAHAGLADAYMAGHYYANRPLDETARLVESEVEKALAIDPELAEAYAARGVLRTEQWRLDEAIADLRRAIAIRGNYADAYVRLGAAYEYRGEPRAALVNYDQAAQLDPLQTVLHVRRCLTLQNLGRYREAELACDRAFQLQPDIPNALWSRGLIELARGDIPKSIEDYREALARAPNRADLWSQLGWLYLDAGQVDGAREAFDRSVAAMPGNVYFALERARLFAAANEAPALRSYLRGIDLTADHDSAELLDAALLQLTCGDAAAAGALANRATASPQFAYDRLLTGVWETRWGRSPVLTLALVAKARGDAASAARHLQALESWLQRVEKNGQVWHGANYLRASIHALRGDDDAAFAELARATKRGWRRGWWLRVDPAFAALRADPRFVSLLSQARATPKPGSKVPPP